MSITELLTVLFPHLAGVCVERVSLVGRSIRIRARTQTPEATCPGCGSRATSVHSYYGRRLSDSPVAGQETQLHLQVRRFFCRNDECGKKTFAEQVPGLTVRHGRRSTGLREALRQIALALGGRAGERLAGRLAAAVGRSTLLRLIRGMADPQPPTPRVLGVDDFAWRRGAAYGTVLVDVETRRPVDLLPDRSAESVAAWLDAHPGVEVICRDRAGCYAEGTRRGAPLAIQVADRWHLLHNLTAAVERVVARHRGSLREPDKEPDPPVAGSGEGEQSPGAARTRARHAEVHQAVRRGLTITEISRDLRLDRKTIRRYVNATTAEELLGEGRSPRKALLDQHLPYLHQRWDEGCRSTNQLLEELRTRGYRGSMRTLRRVTAQLRTHTARLTPPPAPKVREVTGWIVTPPDKLTDNDRETLQKISDRCPEIAVATELTQQFAEMLVQLRGKDLDEWANWAETSPVRELRGFAAGLRRDWEAVKAGLTLPYSSGPVEGNVNRIIMWNLICQASRCLTSMLVHSRCSAVSGTGSPLARWMWFQAESGWVALRIRRDAASREARPMPKRQWVTMCAPLCNCWASCCRAGRTAARSGTSRSGMEIATKRRPACWAVRGSAVRPVSSSSVGVRAQTRTSTPSVFRAVISSSSQSPPRGLAMVLSRPGPRRSMV